MRDIYSNLFGTTVTLGTCIILTEGIFKYTEYTRTPNVRRSLLYLIRS